LRSYELIRSFASSATLYTLVDAPFALVFLVIMVAIGGTMVAAACQLIDKLVTPGREIMTIITGDLATALCNRRNCCLRWRKL